MPLPVDGRALAGCSMALIHSYTLGPVASSARLRSHPSSRHLSLYPQPLQVPYLNFLARARAASHLSLPPSCTHRFQMEFGRGAKEEAMSGTQLSTSHSTHQPTRGLCVCCVCVDVHVCMCVQACSGVGRKQGVTGRARDRACASAAVSGAGGRRRAAPASPASCLPLASRHEHVGHEAAAAT